MSDPISQPDIADRQLLVNAPRVGTWTEIGQAEVTYTIFGKAKVRIIRKNDKARRTRMLLVALAGAILAVAAWQGWVATRQTEPVQAGPELSQTATVPVQAAPATQPENIAPVQSAVEPRPITVPAAAMSKPAINQKPAIPQQQPAALVADEQAVAKPAPARRPKAATQGEAVAAESGTPKAPAEKTSLSRATPPSQPAVPAVATPPSVKTVERPAASNAAAASPTVPSTKEAAPTVSPAGERQPATPVNMQSK